MSKARSHPLSNCFDAFRQMDVRLVAYIVPAQAIAIARKRLVNAFLRCRSVDREVPKQIQVGTGLASNRIDGDDFVPEVRAEVLQHERVPRALVIRVLHRVLCSHALRPRDIVNTALQYSIDRDCDAECRGASWGLPGLGRIYFAPKMRTKLTKLESPSRPA